MTEGGGSKKQDMTPLPDDYQPNDRDVICSWARQNHKHTGNMRFRSLVVQYAPAYIKAETKYEKTRVIADLIEKVRRDSPNGGFVKKDYYSGRWFEIGSERARDKVGHAIRKAADKLVKQHSSKKDGKSKEAKKDHSVKISDDDNQTQPDVGGEPEAAFSHEEDITVPISSSPLPIDTTLAIPDSPTLDSLHLSRSSPLPEQHLIPQLPNPATTSNHNIDSYQPQLTQKYPGPSYHTAQNYPPNGSTIHVDTMLQQSTMQGHNVQPARLASGAPPSWTMHTPSFATPATPPAMQPVSPNPYYTQPCSPSYRGYESHVPYYHYYSPPYSIGPGARAFAHNHSPPGYYTSTWTPRPNSFSIPNREMGFSQGYIPPRVNSNYQAHVVGTGHEGSYREKGGSSKQGVGFPHGRGFPGS